HRLLHGSDGLDVEAQLLAVLAGEGLSRLGPAAEGPHRLDPTSAAGDGQLHGRNAAGADHADPARAGLCQVLDGDAGGPARANAMEQVVLDEAQEAHA